MHAHKFESPGVANQDGAEAVTATGVAIELVERGLVPDLVIRRGIQQMLRQRLAELPSDDPDAAAAWTRAFIAGMDAAEIAPVPALANEQHYELPADFFALVLGRQRKYSGCYWAGDTRDLDVAEEAALALYGQRAQLADGQQVLELGCGWGSLTLWMAEHYPTSRITAVSNSHSQHQYIAAEAARRGLNNIRVITEDMNRFDTGERFDRIVSVEMFEHMRNHRRLFERVASWLSPGGLFFMHIFCHRALPYLFGDGDSSDWMGRHFFSGGMMPSDDLPLHFQDHLRLVQQWRWNGRHYQTTANAWLANMDRRRDRVMPILRQTYGGAAQIWWRRWRVFFMSCAELFGYDGGGQWWVSHYLFERQQDAHGTAE